MASVWERLGTSQSLLKQKKGTIANPFNSDGYLPFGTALDISKSLPKNPAAYNITIEKYRKEALDEASKKLGTKEGIGFGAEIGGALGIPAGPAGMAAGAALGAVTGGALYGISSLDKKTDGKLSNALMSATRGTRSNYAFTRDAAKHDAGLGMIAGLNMIIGGTIGGLIGIAGGPAGVIAGAGLGAAIGGKIGRNAAVSGALGGTLQESAKYSQTAKAQERYNFGTDTTRLAGKIVGIVPGAKADELSSVVQDTSMGIGAITSGIGNFIWDTTTAADIKGMQVLGKVAKAGLRSGVVSTAGGPIGSALAKSEAKAGSVLNMRLADRLDATIDALKKTGAGEQTAWSNVFKFARENDLATIMDRAGMRGEMQHIGAQLLVGQSDEVQSLVYRIGYGDISAIEELAIKHPATHMKILRYEGVLDTLEARMAFPGSKLPEHVLVGKQIPLAEEAIKAELLATTKEYSWLNKALKLDTALLDTGVSRFSGLEKWRNDVAKQRNANHMGGALDDITSRETALGRMTQRVYQSSSIGPLIRTVERNMDDAPHSTINYNDNVGGASRVRTTLRSGVTKQIFPELEARELHNSYITARTAKEKAAVVSKIEERVFEQVANKYGVPSGIKDLVLEEYIILTQRNVSKAQTAAIKKEAYMIAEDGSTLIDPQLVSQLANGGYLPDIELVDKAFARYAKKRGEEVSLPMNSALIGKTVLEEFNSIWRSLTLARTGFPINIIRDSTLRTWGDGVLFDSLKALAGQELEALTRSGQTFSAMKRWAVGVKDPKQNLKHIRSDIKLYENSAVAAKESLAKWKYDPAKPPKDIPAELERNLSYLKNVEDMAKELRRQENALIANIPAKKVGRDATTITGYDFPGPFSGRFGQMSAAKLRGKDDIRALVASTRELEMAWVRRDRDGGRAIKATAPKGEDIHIQAWDTLLNNALRNDTVAREIMASHVKGLDPIATEKAVVAWIRSPASGDLIEQFGFDAALKHTLRYKDAKAIYQRVLAAIHQFAPDVKLQKLIMEDKVTPIELKKMYPDITKRPDVISDLALDLTGKSNFVRGMSQKTKDVVTWMATVPTNRLSYSPYFRVKYEQKLQSMVAVANAQGRNLVGKEEQFAGIARSYAMREYRDKINAFNRDMNYPELINWIVAFFPAVVEQWRAYGKLTYEHPEFPLKAISMSNIPEYISNVKVDQYGTEYSEVTLPVLGITGRLPSSWWQPWNPTGGNILSAGPLATVTVNEVSKHTKLPGYFEKLVLPFGTQANAVGALTPNTVRRGGQAFQTFFLRNGEQFNKDMDMFIKAKLKEHMDENAGRKPNAAEYKAMGNEAEKDSVALSFIRAIGAGILPSQPRYVTGLQAYADILSKYEKEEGDGASELFLEDYPEYFMLVDQLTDSTSGLHSDETAVNLVKNHKDTVELLVATVGEKNLGVLGAVFNDADYAFSSAANAYLVANAIPGTREKFKKQGAALENSRSSIVSEGWRKWSSLIEIVSQEVAANGYSTSSGYGAAIIKNYKEAYMQKAKTDNPIWYSEKKSPSFSEKGNPTIAALTIAANTPALWKELSKQPRWHTIVEYLNFRYDVYDELKRRGVTLAKAGDIEVKAAAFVAKLRKEDITFGRYYDRYFDGDTFDDPTLEK